jgi:predicted kinase
VLKEFYQSQEPTDDILQWARIEKLKISTRENFRQSESFLGAMISAPAFEAIRFYTDCFYKLNLRLLERRLRERRVRDCHGDLHLDHVHLTPKQIAIYDCIEFNDRFRYIDIASDVAFLAMDLDYQGRRDLSHYFVGRMAKVLSDESMPEIIDFYKCYRAFVRGKVHSLRGADARADRNRARRYFQLALQYATCGSEPIVIIVMGRIASGKSALAKSLSQELRWNVFSSDRIRKELAGVPLHRRGNEAMRRQLYSEGMARRTYKALARRAVLTAREKSGVILDATYGRRWHREQLRKELTKRRLNYCFIEAQAPDAILKKRLGERGARAREISDARLEDFETLNRSYEGPVELPADKIIAVSTARALATGTSLALKALARNRAQRPSGR